MIRRCICFLSLLGAFALPLGGKLCAAPVNFFANLSPVNNSGVNGTASLTLDGNSLTVLINATGLEVGQIHPQHIHGFVNGNASSTNFTDFNSNGLIDEFESELATGPAITGFFVTRDGRAVGRLHLEPHNTGLALARRLFPCAQQGNSDTAAGCMGGDADRIKPCRLALRPEQNVDIAHNRAGILRHHQNRMG